VFNFFYTVQLLFIVRFLGKKSDFGENKNDFVEWVLCVTS